MAAEVHFPTWLPSRPHCHYGCHLAPEGSLARGKPHFQMQFKFWRFEIPASTEVPALRGQCTRVNCPYWQGALHESA